MRGLPLHECSLFDFKLLHMSSLLDRRSGGLQATLSYGGCTCCICMVEALLNVHLSREPKAMLCSFQASVGARMSCECDMSSDII